MIRLRLLGEQWVAGADGPVPLSQRGLDLLAVLVVHAGAPQSRDRLAGSAWPESSHGQARTNLRRVLHLLRAALPEVAAYVVATPVSLLWRDDRVVDADVVTHVRAVSEARRAADRGDPARMRDQAMIALEAYGGDLLPSSTNLWVEAERRRLHREQLALLDRLGDVAWAWGDLGTALDAGRRRVELEPLEEVGYRRLLTLQAIQGDRSAAIRTFRQCVDVLERDLGVGPAPATIAAYENACAGTLSERLPS